MFDIVMIGSSIFEFWGQPKWGALKVTNKAIRGTQSKEWLDMALNGELNDLPAHKKIIIYCGSNDLIYGNSPENIISNVCTLLDNLALLFPNTQLGYFSIMLCPQKVAADQVMVIDHINKQIKRYCGKKHHYFHFNDFIENDSKWFIEDGLHLTQNAYLMLNNKLTPVLQAWGK